MQNLIKFYQFIHKILSRNKILTITKAITLANFKKLRCNNPNLDLVLVNAYAKFDQIPPIHSQDIEQK